MKCIACDSEDFTRILQKHMHDRHYTLIRCDKCGFVTVEPYPTRKELDQFYTKEYDFSYMNADSARLKKINLDRLQVVLKHKKSGSLLEIGSGSGLFMREAQKYFDVQGIEFSDYAAKIGRKNFGLNIMTANLYDFQSSKKYDVIVMFHVLEHVLDPSLALQKIKSMLKKDGVLVMAFPNIDSLSFKLFGKNWEWINPPKHLSYFNEKSFSRLANRNGLRVIKRITHKGDHYPFLLHLIITTANLLNLRKIMLKTTKRKKSKILGIYEMLFSVFNIISYPFTPIRKYFGNKGRGSELVVVCKIR